MCAAVTATPSTRRGCSRRTYPRFCPRAMSRHVCTNPSCVAATMVVPSNASAETAAGTVPRRRRRRRRRRSRRSDTAPTRMVCFSDQSRTSRTRRRALASPSAATRMFLNSAQCWNAPRAGVSGVKETLRTSRSAVGKRSDDADAEARAAGGPKPANELARPAAPTIGGNVDVHTTSVTDAPGWYCRETRTRSEEGRMRASDLAGKPMDGTRWHARDLTTRPTRRTLRPPAPTSRAIADPLSDGTHAGSGTDLQGAQTVSIRVDASSMTTISRGTCHSHVQWEGRQSRERRERLPKKTKRQRCISAWICTDDVVEEWNDRRRALGASPRSARLPALGACLIPWSAPSPRRAARTPARP